MYSSKLLRASFRSALAPRQTLQTAASRLSQRSSAQSLILAALLQQRRCSSSSSPNASLPTTPTSATSSTSYSPQPPSPTRSDAQEPKLQITFTCTAPTCTGDTRSTHQFTKRSYEKGIVIIQCPGCKSRHLIADNMGWFKDDTEGGALRNVEDILRARGETVERGTMPLKFSLNGEVVEYSPE